MCKLEQPWHCKVQYPPKVLTINFSHHWVLLVM